MSFINELKRRNVLRMAAAYIVTAWLVIQVVETIFPAFGFGDEAIRLVTIIFGIGLVPTLIVSWVFEITPEGLKRDQDVDHSQAIALGAGKKLDRIIMVILALGLAYFAFDKFVLDPARDATELQQAEDKGRIEATLESYGDKSIAVIPFLNLSTDPEQAFFADGVAEEILNLLAKIPELRVTSRSSSFTFRGKDIEIPEIAKRLNVAHILEGSVRRAGDRIRVTAQLIEAQSDTHLWSETYDRTLDDIFAIQDEIAEHIVDNLYVELINPMPRSARTDPEALALTLQARQVWNQSFGSGWSENDAVKMTALLDRALEIDPNYIDALVWYNYANFMKESLGMISKEEDDRQFQEIAQRVLAIDPDQGMILMLMGWEEAFINLNIEAAAKLFERAIQSEPNNSEVLRQVGRLLFLLGRYDESLVTLERAVAIDPLCSTCIYFLSRGYMVAGEYEKAEQARERFFLISGGGGYYHYGLIKLLLGKTEAALEIFQDETKVGEYERFAGGSMATHTLGRMAESDEALVNLKMALEDEDPENKAYISILIAVTHAWRGEPDSAFEWANKAWELKLPQESYFDTLNLLADPIFRSLHNDPGWEKFLERVGLSTRRLEAIEFSVRLPD